MSQPSAVEQSAAHAAIPLTKMRPPRVSKPLVERPRLQGIMQNENLRVVVVRAPAGYGKTTLMTQWCDALRQAGTRCAWISLDSDDNEPFRFLNLIAVALTPSGSRRDLPRLSDGDLSGATAILASLINGLLERPEPVAVFIDDYHVIANPQINLLLEYLVSHSPEHLRLFIGSRTEPAVALSKLRIEGCVRDVVAMDLAFEPAEAESFIRADPVLSASPALAGQVMAKTEGWVAGLRLASAALSGARNPELSVADLSGRNADIANYLMENVLRQLPQTQSEFLLKTSVLTTMCGELCDMALGESECQARLDELDRSNVLIYRLDTERLWFKYHDLFANFLRDRLDEWRPELASQIRRQASAWYAAKGLYPQAIDYALSAGDFMRATELILSVGWGYIRRAHFAPLRSWIARIPESARAGNHRLVLLHAWSHLYADHDFDLEGSLGRLLLELESGEREAASDAERRRFQELRAETQVLKCAVAVVKRDEPSIDDYSLELAQSIPDGNLLMRCLNEFYSSFYFRARGRLDLSRSALERAIDLALRGDVSYIEINGHICLALVFFQLGQWQRAEQIYQKLLALADEQGWRGAILAGSARVRYAQLLYGQDRLDEAASLLDEAIHTLDSENSSLYGVAVVERSRLRLARGDADAAMRDIATAKKAAGPHDLSRILLWARLIEVRIALASGDLLLAAELLNTVDKSAGLSLEEREDAVILPLAHEQILLARSALEIRHRNYDTAIRLASRALRSAKGCGRFISVIEAMNMQALCWWLQGATTKATVRLLAAANRAEVAACRRPFMDIVAVFPEFAKVIAAAGARWSSRSASNGEFLNSLLTGDHEARSAPKPGKAADLLLLDPMTDREIQIVKLLSDGLNNREIGQRIALSPETVKWHLKNLYSKMSVHNRVEAVARGRALGYCA